MSSQQISPIREIPVPAEPKLSKLRISFRLSSPPTQLYDGNDDSSRNWTSKGIQTDESCSLLDYYTQNKPYRFGHGNEAPFDEACPYAGVEKGCACGQKHCAQSNVLYKLQPASWFLSKCRRKMRRCRPAVCCICGSSCCRHRGTSNSHLFTSRVRKPNIARLSPRTQCPVRLIPVEPMCLQIRNGRGLIRVPPGLPRVLKCQRHQPWDESKESDVRLTCSSKRGCSRKRPRRIICYSPVNDFYQAGWEDWAPKPSG